MASGSVKWFNATKGFGFIQPSDGGKDVFVHISAVERSGLNGLNEGQKISYQDAGSWTLMKSTPVDRAQAAWLYAQFVTSKTVDVKKAHVGVTLGLQEFVTEFTSDAAAGRGGYLQSRGLIPLLPPEHEAMKAAATQMQAMSRPD